MSPSINIRGALLNLDLGHTRADIIRAAMEGVALELRVALDALRKMQSISPEMLVVGGGSRSKLWRQIFADAYNIRIVKTNIDQQAAALGAAACAAVGVGLWDSFEYVDQVHQVIDVTEPDPSRTAVYEKLLPVYQEAGRSLGALGDRLFALDL